MKVDGNQFNRFKDAPWFKNNGKKIYCIVGGAGGISSWLSLFLSRAGFDVIIYDFDIVEEHNVGGQLYTTDSVGLYKVEALSKIIDSLSQKKIECIGDAYNESSMVSDIMFSGFDNMKARKVMFTNWVKSVHSKPAIERKNMIFIDGRLTAEQMQIFCICGDNEAAIKDYEISYLFSDDEVRETSCTFKQTTHAAAIIAGLMTGFLTNHISNVNEKRTVRKVPFYTEYFIPINLFTEHAENA